MKFEISFIVTWVCTYTCVFLLSVLTCMFLLSKLECSVVTRVFMLLQMGTCYLARAVFILDISW
jgi:hypothetical protein